jgi:cytochrome c-type biogenesis protein
MTVNEISFFTPLLAVVFGLLSFASPCCLPLLPAYLGLLAGSSTTAGAAGVGRRRLLRNGLGFVAGLSLVFALLGATASTLGLLLLHGRPLLMEAGGLLIVVFGLHMLGALRLGWLARTYLHAEPGRFAGRGGCAAAVLMGAAFGIGWTPCIGLFLGSLLTLAAQQDTVVQGTLLLLCYSFGLGVPFLLAGLAADHALGWARGLRGHLGLLERAGGVILVGMGLLLFTGQLTLLTSWAIRTFGLGLAL